jgi:hypothetical protein
MISLTSDKFAEKVFGYPEKLMTLENYCFMVSGLVILTTLYVHFCTTEQPETEEMRTKRI